MRDDRQGKWHLLKPAIALVLCLAAAAKILEISQILAGDGLLTSEPILLAVIGFEIAAATYVLIGNPFWSWALTLATFSVFSLVSGFSLLSGTHCNCISVRLGPEIMLPLDLSILAMSIWLRPNFSLPYPPPSIARIGACVLAGSLLAGVAFVRDKSTDRADPIRFLLADECVDSPWPLGSAFHSALKDLNSGRWLVLVVRRDCEHCRAILAEHFVDPKTHRPNERTALLIAGGDSWPFLLDSVALDTNPSTSIQWPEGEPFVASPAVFVLENGHVISAADGSEAEAFMEDLMHLAER